MNQKQLLNNKKMLGILLGFAVVAIAGVSFASAQVQNQTSQQLSQIQGTINLSQVILSSVKTRLTDAANTAAGSVANGKVIGGMLTMKQNYVVYDFKVIDDKNMVYHVIVDPGNGQVLNTSAGHQFSMNMLGMGMQHHHGGMKHGFHKGGFSGTWGQSPQGNTTPSSDTLNPQSGS